MRRLALAALVTLLATPAFAQTSAEPYSATYKACQNRAVTTADIVGCAAAEHRLWDAALNRNYQAMMRELRPERQAALRDVQRKWLAYRDAHCAFLRDPEGGTITAIEAALCMLGMTASRAQELDPAPR